MIKLLTRSEAETRKLGRKIGKLLNAGDVVAFSGELGAGKTTLIKGIAKGLGIEDESEVLSPSFVLIHEYEGREKVYHIDWYRLKSVEGPDEQLARECFDSKAVTLVEWAERGRWLLPADRLEIDLQHKGPNSRLVKVAARGRRHSNLLKLLAGFIVMAVLTAGLETEAPARQVVESRGGKVSVVKYDDGAWELLVGGKPYFIKGVLFSPVLIGESPAEATMRDWMLIDDDKDGRSDIAFQTWFDRNQDGRKDSEEAVGDFGFLKEIGANTIRLYHLASDDSSLGDIYKMDRSTILQFDHAPNKELLRRLYQDYGIRVIIGSFMGSWTIGSGATWGEGTDYRNPVHRENIKKSVKAMVLDHKDEPYTLLWLLGNENNIAHWSKSNAQAHPEAYATLVGEVARMIHALDPDHPVAVCEGDSFNVLREYAKHAPEIDIVAYNAYRGPYGFASLWKGSKAILDRPVFISEFGMFAYDSLNNGEDEELQLSHIKGEWSDIVSNSAGNSIGGIVFDWADRWYMDGTPLEHNGGARHSDLSPDKLYHEEWFGIHAIDSADRLKRRPRKAAFFLKQMWNEPGSSENLVTLNYRQE